MNAYIWNNDIACGRRRKRKFGETCKWRLFVQHWHWTVRDGFVAYKANRLIAKVRKSQMLLVDVINKTIKKLKIADVSVEV